MLHTLQITGLVAVFNCGLVPVMARVPVGWANTHASTPCSSPEPSSAAVWTVSEKGVPGLAVVSSTVQRHPPSRLSAVAMVSAKDEAGGSLEHGVAGVNPGCVDAIDNAQCASFRLQITTHRRTCNQGVAHQDRARDSPGSTGGAGLRAPSMAGVPCPGADTSTRRSCSTPSRSQPDRATALLGSADRPRPTLAGAACPPFLRPEPILRPSVPVLPAWVSVDAAAERLARGGSFRVVDHYGRAADVLDALAAGLGPLPAGSGEAQRAERRRRRSLASGLLVPVESGRVALQGGGTFSLLRTLYPDHDRFWLPLVEAQALHRSHRLHAEGVPLAVLGHRLHPWHGVYCPTRTAHLELFSTWLAQDKGTREHAIDVGTGCGVLAFLLARRGFSAVTATDINPNAVHSVRLDVARLDPQPPVTVREADLLDGIDRAADLIVFNPPWMQGAVDDPLDQALFYEGDLFERFFAQAPALLKPGGRVVLVFSNVMQLLRPDLPHPIEQELEQGRFVLEARQQRRVRAKRGRRTRERVEVWVLGRA